MNGTMQENNDFRGVARPVHRVKHRHHLKMGSYLQVLPLVRSDRAMVLGNAQLEDAHRGYDQHPKTS